MKITALTSDTLIRFQNCVNVAALSTETIEKIEHSAYCANMGAENKEAAWSWFKHLVADDFQILLPAYEDTTRETAPKGRTVADIRQAVQNRPARSAWGRGVTEYALDLLDDMAETDFLAGDKLDKDTLLNGADNWNQYSWGGGSLIYDCDIAERLCSPSELKRRKGGDLPPNSREEWLDVQARALTQAAALIMRIAREGVAK